MHEKLKKFLKIARKKEDKLLTKLQEKVILDPKLLDIVWKDRLKDIEDLTRLLVKFDFFVPLFQQVAELGLKWKEYGSEKSSTGSEINNQLLVSALQKKIEFKREEWELFQLDNVSSDRYVNAGNRYFTPATDTKESSRTLYLVSVILSKRLTIHQSTVTTPKLVGYLFFTLKETMEGFRNQGYVLVQD